MEGIVIWAIRLILAGYIGGLIGAMEDCNFFWKPPEIYPFTA